MTNKQFNRKLNRTAGGSVADSWKGAKSAAHEIREHYCADWRKEWVKRGLGEIALRGPVGRLP